jgi:hypothetical protein
MELEKPTPRWPQKSDEQRWDTAPNLAPRGHGVDGMDQGASTNGTSRERRIYVFATSQRAATPVGNNASERWVPVEGAAPSRPMPSNTTSGAGEQGERPNASLAGRPPSGPVGCISQPVGEKDDLTETPPELRRPVARVPPLQRSQIRTEFGVGVYPRGPQNMTNTGTSTTKLIRVVKKGRDPIARSPATRDLGKRVDDRDRKAREERTTTRRRTPARGVGSQSRRAAPDSGRSLVEKRGVDEKGGEPQREAWEAVDAGDAVAAPGRMDDRVRKYWEASKERRRAILEARAARLAQLDARASSPEGLPTNGSGTGAGRSPARPTSLSAADVSRTLAAQEPVWTWVPGDEPEWIKDMGQKFGRWVEGADSDGSSPFYESLPEIALVNMAKWTKEVPAVDAIFMPLDALVDSLQSASIRAVEFGRAVRSGRFLRGNPAPEGARSRVKLNTGKQREWLLTFTQLP